MPKSIVLHTAAAALIAGMLLPVASIAQTRATPNANPFGQAQECTQLELSVGLRGDECGKLTLSEIAALKHDKDNVN